MSEQVEIRLVYPDGSEFISWAFKGKRLWEIIALDGRDPGGSCGGKGTCGKCKVRIEGEVSELSDSEREHLLAEEIKNGDRLACHCIIKGPMTVYLDYADFNLQTKSGLNKDFVKTSGKEPVKNHRILIPGMDKDQPIPIYRRLANALAVYRLALTMENLNDLSQMDRIGRPSIELNALIWENQVVKYIGRKKARAYGIALDLGSTSLFAALIDMENGQVLTLSSKANMQRIYGADIISRVNYCLENADGLEKLQRIVINNINSMIEEMLKETGGSSQDIYRFSVAANPVILHIFMGLNPGGFAQAPYSGLFLDEIKYPAADLGLDANKDAEVLVLPQVGGFVGADTMGCLLSLPADNPACYLLIDIGTNGEIVLCKRGEMWAASAAAGPAFEGGGISSGIRAGSGAIDRVYWKDDGELEFNMLGDKPIRGLCGSAIIDLIACLLQANYMEKNGTFISEINNHFTVREGPRGTEIVLFEGEESSQVSPVVFNQEDVRQLQLAKGAIRTAIDLLVQEAEIKYGDLDRIYVAGAFGNYLDRDNAILIGMLPPISRNKIIHIGNAAGQGAITYLLSEEKRRQARLLKDKIHYIELAQHPDFQDKFINNLNF